ncbi:MAG: excinuclease ABC subunit UvrC [Alphaproteobacteria bacterium]
MSLEILQKYVKIAPTQSGVYRMLDKNDVVLYVGKAKNIKKRIVAYTKITELPKRLQMMVTQTVKMEFVTTETEHKALILENELIKSLNPKYNILLKDDKTFPYLAISTTKDFPVLEKYRGTQKKGYQYFGPFANVKALNETIELLSKIFQLRNCKDMVFKNRSTPCLMHQIKRCSAPCVDCISKEEYQKSVNLAIDFLKGKNKEILKQIEEDMKKASEFQNFEHAIVKRNQLDALKNVYTNAKSEYNNIDSADVIGIYQENDLFAIEIFFIRQSKNFGNAIYFPKKTKGFSPTEVLEAFISEFYTKNIAPKEIVLSTPIENQEFLASALKSKINFYQKGNKQKLINQVLENAKNALRQKIAFNTNIAKNLAEMKDIFGLPKVPQRIEVYDNSHTFGVEQVGAMIVATPDGFDKKQYRKFNIKGDIHGDDLEMMKEVLHRRFSKITPENRPDIVLLDGGRNQLNAVMSTLFGFDLEGITFIAISKGEDRNAGREEYHMPYKESFSLEYASPLAFYMQNIRDEAHRFAITFHRSKRDKIS